MNLKETIRKDLGLKIEGEIISSEEAIKEVSEDFGRIIHKEPLLIMRPRSSNDVSEIMKYAYKNNIRISTRAAAHSQSGQSLNEGGILIDTANLNNIYEINEKQHWFLADAGIIWKELVEKVLPFNLLPPVLTNNLNVSLGGTHSMAGLGISSFRYGTQADNCLELEIVSYNGEVLWCSNNKNKELFSHSLCGLGQFGLITKIKHKLKTVKPLVISYYLLYDEIEALLKDARMLMEEERIDYIEGWAVPLPQGFKTINGSKRPFVQWFYPMHITIEIDSHEKERGEEILSDLSYYRFVHKEIQSIYEFSLRLEPLFEIWRKTGYWNNAHPWMECILPWSIANDYIKKSLENIPPFILGGGHILLWPAKKKDPLSPLFMIPKEDFILGFGILPGIPKNEVRNIIPLLNQLSDLCMQMGGKRYLSGWIEFDLPRWKNHFGDYFYRLSELKNAYDPNRLLNSDFIPL